MFYLGIDIGKRTHVASIMNAEGKVVLKGFSFLNSLEGAHALLDRLNAFSATPDDFLIGMEATGHYWLALFSFLMNKVFIRMSLILFKQTAGEKGQKFVNGKMISLTLC